MRLRNQVVLATGADRGIGQAVALAFAREGARVAVYAEGGRPALGGLTPLRAARTRR